MNLFLHLLIAMLVVAGLILLRTLVHRYALQARIRGGHTDTECEQVGCFRGCEQDADATPDAVAGENT
jgi:hypothetical protein